MSSYGDESAYDYLVGAMYSKHRRPTALSAYGESIEDKQNKLLYKGERVSPDVFEIDECQFECPETHKMVYSNLIYINGNNNQAYWYCKECRKLGQPKRTYFHFIKNPLFKFEISGYLQDKYKKVETDGSILDYVDEQPGINHYQLGKALGMSKGRVRRGVNRLKKLGLIKTRTVGKSIRVYPKTAKGKPDKS